MKNHIFLVMLSLLLSSCGALSSSSDTGLSSGVYSQRINGKSEEVYLELEEDELSTYKLQDGHYRKLQQYDIEEAPGETAEIGALWKHSFDLDLLTIPLKFRPAQKGVPAQLNSDLNGSVYLGYRMDRYKPHYHKTPLGESFLETTHIGFSFGYFTGIGNTFMSPTTTNNHIETEYDGIVWLNGVAAIVGINNFTVGFSLGFDTLLDENRSHWIYQTKPWAGLAVGLNLN